MKHPEIVLLPLLILSDYFLTVLGAVEREKGYSKHFRTPHYELNPKWQEAIRRKKWLNPRHLLLTVLVSGGLAGMLEFADLPRPWVEMLFGCLFVLFGMVIGRHLSNILIFRRFARSPGEVSGQVDMPHSFSLAISTYQYLVAAIPVAVIAVFSPTPFVVGGLAGAILILLIHCIWILRHRKAAKG